MKKKEKEDFDRIAKEFGETPPDDEEEPKEEKEEQTEESKETKAKDADTVVNEIKEEKPKEKPKKETEPVNAVKVKNGFSLGMMAALGFWLTTAVLAALFYVVLNQLGFV